MRTLRTLLSWSALTIVIVCAGVSGQEPLKSQQGGQAEAPLLAHQYVKSDKEEDKRELRKKLTDLLSKQFDQQAQRQQTELEDLDREIKRLRSLLAKRLDAKSKIVERRFEQLVQDAEGLGWNAPSNPRPNAPAGPKKTAN